MDTNDTSEQVSRERSQREAALGKRARAVLRGDLGPVLQRWVGTAISPVAIRLRAASGGILQGEAAAGLSHLASPLFGLPTVYGIRQIGPILQWALKGSSPGKGPHSTYADDLVLAVLGTAITRCASAKQPLRLTTVVMACAEAARETAMGQFITQVQGAKAMMRVRKNGKAGWGQAKQLSDVANLLAGQVRTALGTNALSSEQRDETTSTLVLVGGRAVVSVLNMQGEWRRIELRRPEPGDWELLDLARHPRGEKDQYATLWASFAMMILCAAQAEAGWFDLVKLETRKSGEVSRLEARRTRHHKAAHGIVLAEGAHTAIKGDLKRWLSLGFLAEPMLTVPENGDYLTVKHRAVAGGRGPMGVKTDAKGSASWAVGSRIMAATPWTVAVDTLRAVRDGPLAELAAKAEPDEVRRETILAGYSSVAPNEFYMPIFMDFRGRVYTRPNLVTYQGSDLQKGLLCFPPEEPRTFTAEEFQAVVLHLGALYGGPDKLDKAPLRDRVEWYRSVEGKAAVGLAEGADEPIQFATCMGLLTGGQFNRIPCQIDGTCNGLQHLTALFRDETAAPFVNLCASTLEDKPRDIYAEVATRVSAHLHTLDAPWARRVLASVKIDRKLCKKPVMVLPYGGTKVAIEDAVLGAILDQGDLRTPQGFCPWTECLTFVDGGWVRDQEAVEGKYLAFRDRELQNHPLLHMDAKRLGTIVWTCITEVIPKPMQAMQAFRDIAKSVGGLSLEWSTGFSLAEEPPLWVIQAKAKSQKSQLRFKGMHLPNSVRGLSLRVGADEVDGGAHSAGIVANFIHSQDAAHLSRTMNLFGKPCFGAVHDCLWTRPSLMGTLGTATRSAFHTQYGSSEGHPLSNPVRLRDVKTGKVEFEGDWWSLARQSSAVFPERGCWEPSEVLESAWFFS